MKSARKKRLVKKMPILTLFLLVVVWACSEVFDSRFDEEARSGAAMTRHVNRATNHFLPPPSRGEKPRRSKRLKFKDTTTLSFFLDKIREKSWV